MDSLHILNSGRKVTIAVRVFQAVIFLLTFVWIFGYLGGLSFSPVVTDTETGENDTFGIFNWHPLLNLLAFVGCMAEAIMTYSYPLMTIGDRKTKKLVHTGLHCGAVVLSLLALVAALKSHTLKKPMPMSNFYSTHSFLGIVTFVMFLAQAALGFMAFLFPQWSLAERQSFAPLHKFFGGATFVTGMMTIMVGLQEKTTFLQLVQKPSVRSALMQIPATMQVFLSLFTVLVIYHVVMNAMPRGSNFEPLSHQTDPIANSIY